MRLLRNKAKRGLLIVVAGVFIAGASSFYSPVPTPNIANARTTAEIEGDINRLNEEVNDLGAQIDALEAEIVETQGEIRSLENELAVLKSEIDKLELEIEQTVKKIERTEAEIEKKTIEIRTKEEEVKTKKEHLSELVRLLYEFSQQNMFDIILSNNSFSDILNQAQYATTIQGRTQENLDIIQDLKAELEATKVELEKQRQAAIELRVQLEGQRLALQNKRAEKDQVLEETKGEEVEFQKLLAQTEELQKQVVSDIHELESELAAQASSGGGGSNAVPPGNGILQMPATGTVTQEYGMTDYAEGGAYGGGIHNGMDIAAPLGTPIYSAHDGTVTATGSLGGVAYGNWVAVCGTTDGLCTLYAHLLSANDVSVGQTVATGDLVGHMGSSGYSTGSHLHFSVFTTFQVVQKPYGPLPIGSSVNPRLYL